MNKIKYCQKCAITKENMRGALSNDIANFGAGYLIGFNTNIIECPYCHGNVIDVSISDDDFLCLRKVSNCNREFLEAMIDLKEKDPIEYQLKMSQFKANLSQTKVIEEDSNKVHCPTCSSTKVKRISATSKVAGAAMFGLFSKTARSQFKCENCGYKW